MSRFIALILVVLVLASCGAPLPAVSSAWPASAPQAPVAVQSLPFAPATVACDNTFHPHTLDYATVTGTRAVYLYDSNGSGVALGDLDADGLTDIVLANLAGPDVILWNRGGLRFEQQELPGGNSRAAAIVDADGDGLLDIVFTRRFERPALWRNTGDPAQRFIAGTLPDVYGAFYAINWTDIDGDGDLDMAAASYDADQIKREGQIYRQRGGIGIFLYTREGDTYIPQRMAKEADALAVLFPDLDGDGRPDILIGNDFNRRDNAWLQRDGAWEPVEPFSYATENTMGYEQADIDNNGRMEIFATDMKPYNKDLETMARWLPMMKQMTKPLSSDDPQHAENTLQVRGDDGIWRNEAYERFLDATGWSWSGKFGDLDQDGWLDAYIVNGMIAEGLFNHLPNYELAEENQALRNSGRGVFEPAPYWKLNSKASGRGMSMADLDNDGDLDIVVNNLQSAALLFENRLCGGQALQIELRQPAVQNRFGIGAQLALHTDRGTFYRDVRALSGYLSGDSPRVHFGVPDGATIDRVEIRWPDGAVSAVPDVAAGNVVTITRNG